MRFRGKIMLAVFLVLAVFSLVFGVFLYVVFTSLNLKELKNQTTQLLAEMYRLDFEVKSIMTATAITTPELRDGLIASTARFQATLDSVDGRSRQLMGNSALQAKMENARALWTLTRRDLGVLVQHMDKLVELGIDTRTSLISRQQYSYLLTMDASHGGQERYHLLSLENSIDSFTAAAYSFGLVFSGLSSEIAGAADSSIRYSIFISISMLAIVVIGFLVFFYLFSHQALVRQLDRLLDEAMKREHEIREAQLSALRYQINPHFLYNTLGSIRYIAVEAKQEQLAEMLRILSRLLRNTISRSEALVTVDAEMKILADYISILQIRYKNRIDVGMTAERGIGNLCMPGLLLQPLIENAVLHGLSGKLNAPGLDAQLRISAEVRHGSLVFEIFDNGSGMGEDDIHRAFADSPDRGRDTDTRDRIGIRNLHERIRIQYGKAYGLSIHSRLGEYTRVVIRLPVIAGGTDAV